MIEWINKQALLKQIDIDSDGEPGYYGDTWKFIDTINNMPVRSDLISRCELFNRLATIPAPPELMILRRKSTRLFRAWRRNNETNQNQIS